MLKTHSSPLQKLKEALIAFISFIVFSFLDVVDFALCVVYRFIDGVVEENPIPCYCFKREEHNQTVGSCTDSEEDEVSETLYDRKSFLRQLGGILRFDERSDRHEVEEKIVVVKAAAPRWSDCSCENCGLSQGKERRKLHFVVKEPNFQAMAGGSRNAPENVIFIHGFLSSSSWWTETVFPNFSESSEASLVRMFAVDLLGFGKSPKPMDCQYKLKDHILMIEECVIKQFDLESFHVVAHSMGCILALALAARYRKKIKSITLVAPPYASSSGDNSSAAALNLLAGRKIWPLLSFGSAVMSWYEHLGRTVCFLYCRNHTKWEPILKLLIGNRYSFLITDMTKHTHHSAWHTMHNVICGGAKLLDKHLEIIKREEIPMKIIHGVRDNVVPLECSYRIKGKVPLAKLEIVENTDHCSVILGREQDFTKDLEQFWLYSSNCNKDSS